MRASDSGDGTWPRIVAAALVLSAAYALLRYHVFASVPWDRLPLWTLNKAVSVAAVIVLSAAYLIKGRGQGLPLGLTGFALSFLHVVLSLPLLTPADYPKLYTDGRLNLSGELAILFGTLASVLLLAPALATLPGMRAQLGPRRWLRWQRAGYLALVLSAAHVVPIGWRGWHAPETWPAFMPPLTLLSFIIALLPVARRRRG